jgi:hypothetical protein
MAGSLIVVFFTLQGFFGGGGMHTQWPHYLSERFPTEVRATATGFCYHRGAIRLCWRRAESAASTPVFIAPSQRMPPCPVAGRAGHPNQTVHKSSTLCEKADWLRLVFLLYQKGRGSLHLSDAAILMWFAMMASKSKCNLSQK